MLTDSQQEEIRRMKRTLPYRIAVGALHPATHEFRVMAVTTRRIPNQLAREGWLVWTA